MSRNAEIIREIYAGGAIDHPGRLEAVVDPEIELVNPADAVEGGIRRGRDEVIAALERGYASFEWTRHEAQEVFDAGDKVVVSVRFTAKGGTSGVELEQHEAHTWTFRDGSIVRFEWGRDLAAALAAAGIS